MKRSPPLVTDRSHDILATECRSVYPLTKLYYDGKKYRSPRLCRVPFILYSTETHPSWPHSNTHNSPSMWSISDIGFASNGRAITRFNLQPGSLSATSQTFKTDDMLNNPQFVYSFESGDHVYFLYRETATEVATEVRAGTDRIK